jgi:anaerobic selenocysteine-containing dehydrogenase
MSSLKRGDGGSYQPIAAERAMDEIAERLHSIIDRHGSRAVAHYFGFGGIPNATTTALWPSFMDAIGSPMRFDPVTIDKSGKFIARAMHGQWMAPLQGYDEPDACLLIGVNPLVSYQGLPVANPARWLARAQSRGMKLIVIDPRRTQVAKRAWMHLQPRPGCDVELLAAMIRTILDEELYDRAFVAENARGLEDLHRVTQELSPDRVAVRADVPAQDLVLAARTFAASKRGYAYAGTGPSMSGPSTLLEYLVLDLETLCGHALRTGERVRNPGTFRPALEPIAQAAPPRPAYGYGLKMRVRGLEETPAGLPTAALADEILLGGEERVRALISCGNPVASWPDQAKTIEALGRLELLVQIDAWMSHTAQHADYVVAAKMPLEVPGINISADVDIAYGPGYAHADAYGHYSPAIVEPPPGSDLIEEWEFYFGLAQRLGVPLTIKSWVCGTFPERQLSMSRKPTSDELLEMITSGSRVPLSTVKAHPHGALHPEPGVYVKQKTPGWNGQLELANADMMRDLRDYLSRLNEPIGQDPCRAGEFRLVCRREAYVYNSTYNLAATNHGRGYSPAFMHPADLKWIGLVPGDTVTITSGRASVAAIVQPDESLRRGLVSMAHGFGDATGEDKRMREVGTNTNRLLLTDQGFDRYSGQPRMSNVPVYVLKAASCGEIPRA